MLPDAAIGSIIASAIAGLVVFVSTVLTKEQKTSEFRQVWIDEIRKDISQYIAGVIEVVSLLDVKQGDQEAYAKFIDDNFSAIQELSTLEHRIILRLNSEEHIILIAKIKSFRKDMLTACNSPKTRQSKEDELTEQLTAVTKKMLSDEWKRVKRGEPTFRIVKWGALLSIISLFGFLIYLLLHPQESKKKNDEATVQNQSFQYFFSQPQASPSGKRVIQQVHNNATIIENPIIVAPASNTDIEKINQ
ncbi:hypothetical protein [Undibacterium curvum]|uniref:hypothetical protein n=1 Tax=Undibacterium curvum TaxID=2762294 RepID=UPI003D0DB80B